VSYLVADLVADEVKPHATSESLTLTAWSVTVRAMFETEAHSMDKESLVKVTVSCGDLNSEN
jgi:hypothetical protein